MTAVVVDTNVPLVANGEDPSVAPPCQLAAVRRLQVIRDSGLVVIDDGMRILEEYKRYLSFSGQPGVGDEFFRWLWNVQADARYCEVASITPLVDEPRDFAEIPRVPELSGFDKSDLKFVACALASANSPVIVNAVDSDWWLFDGAFRLLGITIDNICGVP